MIHIDPTKRREPFGPLRRTRWVVRLFRTVSSALFLCAPIYCQTAEPELAAKVDRLAKIQMNWNAGHTPGAAVTLKETSRKKAGDITGISYRLFATGFPKDQVYDILNTSFDLQPRVNLDGVTLDNLGEAVCAGRDATCGDPKKPNDPIDLIMVAAKGEPMRVTLVSEDGRFAAQTYVVPFPILGSDRGCSVEAILLTRNAEAVLVRGSGFSPDANIHFVGDSEGEKQEGDSKAAEDGTYYTVLLPYVKGKSKGMARVALESKSCSPSVSYTWGKKNYHLE